MVRLSSPNATYFMRAHPSLPRYPALTLGLPSIRQKVPKPCASGFFAWIRSSLALKDDELLEHYGLDVVMYQRWLWTMFLSFLISTLPLSCIDVLVRAWMVCVCGIRYEYPSLG